MRKFQLNKETYYIPTSWDEVTLRMRIKAEKDAAELIDNKAIQRIAYISGYANIPLEVLKNTPMPKINKLFKYLKFTNDPLPEKPITEFEFKGEKYTVMESLAKKQFQDFVSCETALENNKGQLHNALPIIIAVLAKKKGETLDDFELEERAEVFMDLPMTIVEPLRVFFYSIGIASKLHSLSSSLEGKEMIINAKANLLKNTLKKQDGLGWWKRLLSSILLKWTMYLEKSAKKFFTTIQSKSSKTN